MRIQKAAATAVLSLAATGIAATTANAMPANQGEPAETKPVGHAQQSALPPAMLGNTVVATVPAPADRTIPPSAAVRATPIDQNQARAQHDQTAHIEAALVGGVVGGIVGALLGAPLVEVGGPIVTIPVGALLGGAIGYLAPVAH